MGAFDDLIPKGAAPAGRSGAFDDLIPAAPGGATKGQPSTAMDVLNSAGAGVYSGMAHLLGLPADIGRGAQWLASRGQALVQGRPLAEIEAENDARAVIPRKALEPFGGAALAARTVGADYKPQTTAGEYAKTVGEFIPGSLLGPGSAARNILAFGVAPGVASETAGQLTKGTPVEPYARAGAGMATTLGAALLGAGGGASSAIGRNVPKGLTEAQWGEAQSLVQRGATWDEALNQVTGGGARHMSHMARVAGSSPEGAAVLDPFYVARSQRLAGDAEQAIAGMRSQPVRPDRLGLRVQSAAEGAVDDVNRAINAAETPYYNAANMKTVPPGDLQFIGQDPAFQAALAAVRRDPIRNKDIAGFADNDVATLIAVRKELGRMEENALSRGPGLNPDRELARNITPVRDRLDQIITATAPEYGQALGVGAGLREAYLDPIKAGPIGKMAATTDAGAQAAAVLPAKPPADFHTVAAQAVRRIVAKDPVAAENLAYSYLKTTLDEAFQRTKTGGETSTGAAGFAATVFGNPEQRKGLEGVIKALPSGQQRWEGFRKVLDVMEATQYRPPPNSATAQNIQLQKDLKTGGFMGEVVSQATRMGTTLPTRLREASERLRYGRNTEAIAKMMTDPASLPLLKQLAKEPSTTAKAGALTLRLLYIGEGAQARQP